MRLLGKSDLFHRWCYSRQGVHKILKRPDFPTPFVTADRGRLDAWKIADVECFETVCPELLDPTLKRNKPRLGRVKRSMMMPKPMRSNVQYLGMRDLTERWTYSRQGVHSVQSWRGFPSPAFIFNQGRGKVWHIADIEEFEGAHRELTNLGIKMAKVRWYELHCASGEYRPRPARAEPALLKPQLKTQPTLLPGLGAPLVPPLQDWERCFQAD